MEYEDHIFPMATLISQGENGEIQTRSTRWRSTSHYGEQVRNYSSNEIFLNRGVKGERSGQYKMAC